MFWYKNHIYRTPSLREKTSMSYLSSNLPDQSWSKRPEVTVQWSGEMIMPICFFTCLKLEDLWGQKLDLFCSHCIPRAYICSMHTVVVQEIFVDSLAGRKWDKMPSLLLWEGKGQKINYVVETSPHKSASFSVGNKSSQLENLWETAQE